MLTKRAITLQGNPAHVPACTIIVVNRMVHGRTVVPNRDRPRTPAEPTGKFITGRMLKQKIKDRPRLPLLHTLDPDSIILIDEQAFPTGFRMGPDDRMLHHRIAFGGILNLHRSR